MSRWFVGSSSSSRSGCGGERAGERAARELAAGEGPQRAVEVGVGEPEAVDDRPRALAPAVAAGGLEARVDVGVARRAPPRRPPPSPSPGGRAPPRARAARGSRRARSRAARCRARAAGAGRAGRRARPWRSTSSPPSIDVSPESIRSSVVLPAPLRPAIVSRSRRSSLNETPRSSGSPAMSLARSDAMRTAMPSW